MDNYMGLLFFCQSRLYFFVQIPTSGKEPVTIVNEISNVVYYKKSAKPFSSSADLLS